MTAVPSLKEDKTGNTSDSGPPSLIEYMDSSSSEEDTDPPQVGLGYDPYGVEELSYHQSAEGQITP